MQSLNCLVPSAEPRATDYVQVSSLAYTEVCMYGKQFPEQRMLFVLCLLLGQCSCGTKTAWLQDMIEDIQKIVENGHGYASGGDVYFDVASFPAYGLLSGRRQVYMSRLSTLFITHDCDLNQEMITWRCQEAWHLEALLLSLA